MDRRPRVLLLASARPHLRGAFLRAAASARPGSDTILGLLERQAPSVPNAARDTPRVLAGGAAFTATGIRRACAESGAAEVLVSVPSAAPRSEYGRLLRAAGAAGIPVSTIDEYGATAAVGRGEALRLRLRRLAEPILPPLFWLTLPVAVACALLWRLVRPLLPARKAVLVVETNGNAFAERDATLLEAFFPVERLRAPTTRPCDLALLFWRLLARLRRFEAVHLFFAGEALPRIALFTRLFGKRLAVAVGGYDANAIPALGYGTHAFPALRRRIARVLPRADAILPVHGSLLDHETDYVHPRREGLAVLFPGFDSARVRVIANGYDSGFFRPAPGVARETLVVAVAGGSSATEARLKGLDVLVGAARLLPEVRFAIAGFACPEALASTDGPVPPNVEVLGRLSPEGLRDLFSRARVVAAASLTEGHPNALCEAMLCGCVPVGSPVNAIPEVIGDTGFVVASHSPEAYAEAFRRAFSADGAAARARIERLYPGEVRARALAEVFNRLLGNPTHAPTT